VKFVRELTTVNFSTAYADSSDVEFQQIITARRSYASAVLGVVILSVCPSVCHTRALWLIQRTYRRYFYTTWKCNPSNFLPPVVGGRLEVEQASRGLSAIAELLVLVDRNFKCIKLDNVWWRYSASTVGNVAIS